MTAEEVVPVPNDGNVVLAAPKDVSSSAPAAPSAVMHRALRTNPAKIVASKGHYLHLDNGRKIYNASCGAAVSCLGHGDERIHAAIMRQLQANEHCHSLVYSTPAAADLAALLVASTGGALQRVYVCSSGSEAVEAALKLARQYHVERGDAARTHVVARASSYHGITLGALGAGGHVARRQLYEPWLGTAGHRSRVAPCYAYRGRAAGESDAAYVARLKAELEAEFARVGGDKVAAVIMEPVVGAALGCVPSVPGYFRAVREVCDAHGALLILDEVMCGSGRSGPAPTDKYPKPLHAWQDPSVGVVPDIMTMGKGLGGGYVPVAAMLASERVIAALEAGSGAFSHGQTYQEHPLACAAALAVMQAVQADDLVANVRAMGELFGRLLHERLDAHPAVGDVRGAGLFWGIEFVADKASKEPFPLAAGVAFGIQALALEDPFCMTVYPGNGSVDGARGDHVLLAPAYNVTADEIRMIVDTVGQVIEKFFAERPELGVKA